MILLLKVLKKGPFDVGFQNFWKLDNTRDYALYKDAICIVKKQPRPILLNLWYPTAKSSKPRMKYSEYFNIISDDPNLKDFSQELYSFTQGVLSEEFFKKQFHELNDIESKEINEYLNLPVSAIKEAPFPKGSFPLIINHSGASSSFEDNSVLFEFLASHGFVVISSQFQDGEGKSLSGDYSEDSYKDIDFIIEVAQNAFNFIDEDNITLLGHSIGTQTILSYQALHRNKKIKKLIGLETSQVYFGESLNYMWPYTSFLTENNKAFNNNDVLLIAEITASFQLFQNMKDARMVYLTIDRLRHHELISQGIHRSLFQIEESKRTPYLIDKYVFLCNSILTFLTGEEIKKPKNAKFDLNIEYDPDILNDSIPNLNATTALTPRQFCQLVDTWDVSKALSYLDSQQREKGKNPLFRPKFIFSWLYELYSENKREDLLTVYNFYVSLGLREGIITTIENWKWIGEVAKKKKLERDCNGLLEILNQ